MNSWIKIEKSLESDPRITRMARTLAACNAAPLQVTNHVTLVIGAVTRLWILADSHADPDDFLDMSVEEINAWIGIPNFCDLMPDCWLVETDGRVQLPDFQAHNGTKAKSTAQGTARVRKHREKKKREGVTGCNADALPDQDQDQDQDQHKNARKSDDVERVFSHWQETFRHPKSKLDTKRRKLIQRALQDFDADVLCESLTGYLKSPHHMGQNDTSTVYDDIGLLLRDAARIEAGLKFGARTAGPASSPLKGTKAPEPMLGPDGRYTPEYAAWMEANP